MTHHHHGHDHHHHQDTGPLSLEDKMVKLLEHWIAHNDDHARTYRDWAEKASEAGVSRAGVLLSEAADMTLAISDKFKEALTGIKGGV